MLTRVMIRMEDAAAIKRGMFHYFLKMARHYGEAILDRQPVPLAGPAALWDRAIAGL